MLSKIIKLPFRYLRYKRFVVAPVWVTFDVTWNCNCRCDYCNYWKSDHRDLATGEVKTVIGNLKRLGVMYLGLSGGEPLLRKDIVEIVEFAKSLGMYVGVNTNGTINREEVYKGLMEAGIDTICFSIDGARAATHERFRKNCPFDRVVEGIKLAVRIRDAGGYATQISTNTVIHRGNVNELNDMIAFGKELGVDRRNFQPVVKTEIDEDAQSEIGFGEEDVDLLENVRDVLKKMPGSNLGGYMDLIMDYCAGGDKARRIECYAGRAFAYVDPKGMLYPCSVMKEPLADLTRRDAEAGPGAAETAEILKKAAAQKCRGCSLICYMERNVMLNRAFDPRMWYEVMFKRYRSRWKPVLSGRST